MLVHVGQHEGYVGGEQVVHFVSQRSFAQELGAADQVADRHVEVGVAGRPVGDTGERVGYQHILMGGKVEIAVIQSIIHHYFRGVSLK